MILWAAGFSLFVWHISALFVSQGHMGIAFVVYLWQMECATGCIYK